MRHRINFWGKPLELLEIQGKFRGEPLDEKWQWAELSQRVIPLDPEEPHRHRPALEGLSLAGHPF